MSARWNPDPGMRYIGLPEAKIRRIQMNAQAAVLRREIEAKLVHRIPGALSPSVQQVPRLQPTGIARLDALLNGGLPLGSVCEATGVDGSGRSSIALSLLASASREGACAYIDVDDALSPRSAAAAGVQLQNLLWIRFAETRQGAAAPKPAVSAPTQEVDTRREQQQLTQQHCGILHPRGETKDLAPALEQMLFYKEERRRRKMEGTPGHPNQPLGLHTASQDQVEWEQFNIRRVDEGDPLRQADRIAAQVARQRATFQAGEGPQRTREQKPWTRLDRALRATDQVLQSSGFRIVVLDLASVPPEQALRIQSATWWRFQKAAQLGDAILLLLTKDPCARSTAACVLECVSEADSVVQGVLANTTQSAQISRQRSGPAFGKKAPGRVAIWDASPLWMQAAGR